MSRVKNIGCVGLLAVFSSIALWAMQADETQNLESIVAAAREAQTKGEFSKAAEYYRKAVKIRPEVAELWANLGLMDSLSGNSSDAIKDFTEATHLNGSMFVPQLFLGIEYLKSNRAETAIPYLQRAEQLNPRDPQVQLALGRAFAVSGRGDRSSDAYLRAIDLTPNNGDAWLGLGMAELQQSSADDRAMNETYKDSLYTKMRAGEIFAEQGKLHRASEAYTSVLTVKSPPPACAHAGYGFVLMRQQEVAKARSQFEQELKLNPGCSLAKLGLAGIHLLDGNTEDALRDLFSIWNADRGFLQENLPLLRDALSEDQRDQLLRMAGELKAHEDAPSADSAKTAGSKGPDALYLSGQYQNCAESLRPHLNALSEASLSILASCAFYTGDYRTASAAARRLKSAAGAHASGLYWESKADQRLAIAALAHAGETDSNSPLLHVLLGDIYRQKQGWEASENEYRKALALEPRNQSASLGLAMALFADGKSDEALSIDKELLTETPDQSEENLLAGEILVRNHHFGDAEAYLTKIRDTGQKFMPRVHALLGEVYFATDRFPQALHEFKMGQVSDDDGSIYYQLGRTYQKIGDKEKADEAFRVSKQLRSQSDDRSDSSEQ
jgi:tetratricopeptide (TPR) repeat protein